MEASANGSSFGIDSLLSHRPGSPVSKGDSLTGECRSPLEFSPRSDAESGCSSPPSPRRECVEEVAQRQGHGIGLPPHLQHAQISAGSQQRTVTSSFLIRDILADCKPLAACAPYSSNGQPTQEAGRLASKIADDFMEKIHSNSSSDSEYKGEESFSTHGCWKDVFTRLGFFTAAALKVTSSTKHHQRKKCKKLLQLFKKKSLICQK